MSFEIGDLGSVGVTLRLGVVQLSLIVEEGTGWSTLGWLRSFYTELASG